MDQDDDFTPRLGRQRAAGKSQGARARRYIGQVLAAANLARGGPPRAASRQGFTGTRNGRGAGVGGLLGFHSGGRTTYARRAIVKARIVRLAGKGVSGAAAHLRYLQRDGTTREGTRGALYGRDDDAVDGKAFGARGAEDRHQFRFIVSPEDGHEYEDLKPLVRRLMTRMEEDLGTPLDWVAVDHFNTGHPHSHIIMRGRDADGADLVIARDYMTSGIRSRLCQLLDLDLGPRTARDVMDDVRRQVDQERLTQIDRTLIRAADADHIVANSGRDAFDQTVRAGRLAKLQRLGLAEPVGAGRYRLAPDLADTLRTLGERGDIIRTMQREFSRLAITRAPVEQVIFDPSSKSAAPLIGRVVARGLADEYADRHYLIVDGVDGRTHYVAIGKAADALDGGSERDMGLPLGGVVRIDPVRPEIRDVDRTIAAVAAANQGYYDIDAHLRHDPSASESFAQAHIRRLEAMRRGGVAIREPSGRWTVAADHLERVVAFEQARIRDQPVTLSLLSPAPVEALVDVEAATWIDRELVVGDASPVRDAGFGGELKAVQARRRAWLIAQGFGNEGGADPALGKTMLATLQRRELLRVGETLAAEIGRPFAEAGEGDAVNGVLRRRLDLLSGRFAVIERSRDFTLVPWRPVLERQIGKPVSGIMRGDGVSWTLGRGRSGPSID